MHALSSVYTQATGDDITRDYLDELQEIVRVSGKPFQLVIQEELRKLNAASSLIDLSPMPSDSPVAAESQTPQLSQSQGAGEEALASPSADQVFFPNVQQSKEPTLTKTNGANVVPMSAALPMDVLSPPSVQQVVVEHVVRTTDAVSTQYVPVHLRSFSLKSPDPLTNLITILGGRVLTSCWMTPPFLICCVPGKSWIVFCHLQLML